MIVAYIGGVGSGKSLSMAKELIARCNLKQLSYCNFPITKKGVVSLGAEDILMKVEDGKKTKFKVNWDFWEDKTNFNICLDELHNFCHARRPSTNVPMINFLAQIRKMLGEDEDYNLYWSSQILERVDLALRDLTTEVIYCECWYNMRVGGSWKWVKKNIYKRVYKKKGYPARMVNTKVLEKGKIKLKLLPLTYVIQYHFVGTRCIEKFHSWEFANQKTYSSRDCFIGNNYFQFYDSFKKIRYGEETYT